MENATRISIDAVEDSALLPADADKSSPPPSIASSVEPDSVLLLLENDLEDPFDIVEATAAIAGEGGGDDGGGSFVRVERIRETTTVMARVDGQGPAASRIDADLTRFDSLASTGNADAPGTPGAGSAPGGGTIPPPTVPPPTVPPPTVPPPIPRVSVLEDHTLSGKLLEGKTGADGAPLSITQFMVNGQIYSAGTTADISDTSRVAKWQKVGTLTIHADGTYTFIPSPDWNGTVPEVSYVMSDGIGLDTDTLAIDVIPVNDQPRSVHMLFGGSTAAGESLVIDTRFFPVFDDRDADVNGTLFLPKEVIIVTLPRLGGTLEFDGTPVTVGQRISLADLQAGKLAYKVDADYNGGELLPFLFQVVDHGGTDNGGIDTSGGYLFRMNVGKIVTGSNGSERMFGVSGRDILIGDAGGQTHEMLAANTDLNVALVLDVNAFTDQKFSATVFKVKRFS